MADSARNDGPPAGAPELGWKELAAFALGRARSLCPRADLEPEDLAQEALLRLWIQIENVRDPRSWLSRVIANLIFSRLRRLRVSREAGAGAGGARRRAESAFVAPEDRLDLAHAAAQVSPADRRCLELYAAGFAHWEIGELLGEPVHRIGPRVARALGRLRRWLGRSEWNGVRIGSDPIGRKPL